MLTAMPKLELLLWTELGATYPRGGGEKKGTALTLSSGSHLSVQVALVSSINLTSLEPLDRMRTFKFRVPK